MSRLINLVLALLLSIFASATSAEDKVVSFAKGKVEVLLPATYSALENSDGSLTVTFGPSGSHKIEFTLHDHEDARGPNDLAEQFVRAYAEKKGLMLRQVPGKIIVLEPGANVELQGRIHRSVQVQVGFGNLLVIMTVTAPSQLPMSPALNEFLNGPLNVAIASLRKRGT